MNSRPQSLRTTGVTRYCYKYDDHVRKVKNRSRKDIIKTSSVRSSMFKNTI